MSSITKNFINRNMNCDNQAIHLEKYNQNTAGTAGIDACGDTSYGEVIRNDETSSVSTKQESFSYCGEATRFLDLW